MDTAITENLERFALTGADLDALKYAAKIVTPNLDDVLDDFYAFATDRAEMARFFPTEDILNHARRRQKEHWEMLLSGDFAQAYLTSAEIIGQVHYRIQLPFELYLSGYARASSQLQDLLLKKTKTRWPRRDRGRRSAALGALTRAFSLDTSLVIDSYFTAQREERERAMNHLNAAMGRMANKDLSQTIPSPEDSDYPERFDGIRTDFNHLMLAMRDIIKTIKDATVDLDLTASEVNDSTESLARRTESQAATLEQTALSVDEISSSVQASSSATADTDRVVSATRTNAANGHSVVFESVKCMKDIAEASAKISDISGLIDEIAFQTNLLALNAGVEAARAGDAGRGFAVVASEVRSLAHRAADSAQQISELIQGTNDLVEHGVDLVDRAGSALGTIVSDVEHAASLSSEIASSSKEQSAGLKEIAQGISQLDSVTQENAAMVEQTAAAMSSMRRDTEAMSQLVNGFILSEVRPVVANDADVSQDETEAEETWEDVA
ncbi:globin-coupled sensor protein [Shimia sp. R10_1]|uniref:methyl-accepting chemotaxis protein n=1 Tax=Shimia sp. R10_1 TaxID=2821095 RepID=UPI001AD972FA|nr:globin-coupled sensor protein [Shimia sp. R10_1]MBO9473155.1 globin-coupled sensor protein [Shimia sp. R10_1]